MKNLKPDFFFPDSSVLDQIEHAFKTPYTHSKTMFLVSGTEIFILYYVLNLSITFTKPKKSM